jgi:hypothetical protein
MPGKRNPSTKIDGDALNKLERQATVLEIAIGEAERGMDVFCPHGEALSALRAQIRRTLDTLHNRNPDAPMAHVKPAWAGELVRQQAVVTDYQVRKSTMNEPRDTDNRRETGARKLSTGTDTSAQRISQEAAENRPPNDSFGLSDPDDAGLNPIEKSVGAGPALAAHSKDAASRGASGQNRAAAAKRPIAED